MGGTTSLLYCSLGFGHSVTTILPRMRLSSRTKQVKRFFGGGSAVRPTVRGGASRGSDLGEALSLKFPLPLAHALQGHLAALEEPEGLDPGCGPSPPLRHPETLPP